MSPSWMSSALPSDSSSASVSSTDSADSSASVSSTSSMASVFCSLTVSLTKRDPLGRSSAADSTAQMMRKFGSRSAPPLGLAGPFARRARAALTLRALAGARARRTWRWRGCSRRLGLAGLLDHRGAGPRVAGGTLAGLGRERLADRADLDHFLRLRRVVAVDVHLLEQRPDVAGEPVQQHVEREEHAGEKHRDRDEDL